MTARGWAVGTAILVAGAVAGPRAQSSAQAGQLPKAVVAAASMTDEEFRAGTYAATDQRVVAPRATNSVLAKYTSEAMRAKIQGTVTVEAVVMPDGTVGRVRVKESLDRMFGLDAQALIAAAQWTFKPGTLDGQAVPVLVTFTQEFRLH